VHVLASELPGSLDRIGVQRDLVELLVLGLEAVEDLMVSSTLGSLTSIRWKRARARVASKWRGTLEGRRPDAPEAAGARGLRSAEASRSPAGRASADDRWNLVDEEDAPGFF